MIYVLILLTVACCCSHGAPTSPMWHGNESASNDTTRIKVVSLQFEHVNTPFIITVWLLLASVAKIMFHHMESITSILPESALLIITGLVVGYMLRYFGIPVDNYILDSHVFFMYLLPPIIFDAGYFMPNRAFFQNVESIMLFAIVGTIFNTLAIGATLFAISRYSWFTLPFNTFDILLFSALISAVDPVAVIAVFEEIHVNDFIFVNVFGEALFNDGVTVVLYKLFDDFLKIGVDNILPIDYLAGIASFFVVAIGGLLIGIISAFAVSLLTKYTVDLRVLAPLFIFLIPYMSYLLAELTSLSPIIAIAVCGMTMKQYVKGNVTTTAANSVKYFIKMLAQSSETVIFLFLGLSTVSSNHHWDTSFVLFTLLFCLVYRIIGTLLQCWLLNHFRPRAKKFTFIDQFILSYGGLRGAIAFGLSVSMTDSIAAKPMFVTTTIAVIYFTVFLQGSTIRPLVNLLNVEKKSSQMPTMAESVYMKYLDYMMSGVEDIAGQKGHYSLVDDFERFNAKILCPILMHNHKKQNFDATKIVRAYAKIILSEAITATSGPPDKRLSRIQREEGAVPPEQVTFNCRCLKTGNKHLDNCPLKQPNMEALYVMFGKMLDDRLEEMKREIKNQKRQDIEDDYMQAVTRASSSSLREMNSDDERPRHRKKSEKNLKMKPFPPRRASFGGDK